MDPWVRRIMAIIIIIAWGRETHEIIGYNCGTPLTNIITMSLLDIEECDIPPQNVNKSLKYIQFIQINEFKSVRVIQYKVEIDKIVKKCGMVSHAMDVEYDKYSYIQETSREACKRMHILVISEWDTFT